MPLSSSSTTCTGSRRGPRTCPGSWRNCVAAELTVLTGSDERDLTRLEAYRAIGGYRQLARARKMNPARVIEEISKASLRGRGGAGFPMGRKLSLVPPAAKRQGPAYVVANADESEPGAFKDREIIRRVPHRFLEGCLIAAHAIEALVLEAAIEEARAASLFGQVKVVLHRGAGAYICGEESALLESLEQD